MFTRDFKSIERVEVGGYGYSNLQIKLWFKNTVNGAWEETEWVATNDFSVAVFIKTALAFRVLVKGTIVSADCNIDVVEIKWKRTGVRSTRGI